MHGERSKNSKYSLNIRESTSKKKSAHMSGYEGIVSRPSIVINTTWVPLIKKEKETTVDKSKLDRLRQLH